MIKILPLLAIALVIRYFALEGGPLLSAQISYGWEREPCEIKKIEVDKQADPKGLKTLLDCIDESELPALLSRGART